MDIEKVEMLNEKLIEYCTDKIDQGFRSGRINDDYIKVMNKVLENMHLIKGLKGHSHANYHHEEIKPLESNIPPIQYKSCEMHALGDDATDFEELIAEMACIGSEDEMWKVVKIIGEYIQELKAFNKSKFDHIMRRVREVRM